jgi:hypothetical protein
MQQLQVGSRDFIPVERLSYDCLFRGSKLFTQFLGV